ncbi:MAG: hypothetical protein ACRDJ4_12185 [Actinomycetota bacterium]
MVCFRPARSGLRGAWGDAEAPDSRILYRLDARSLALQQQLELPDPGVPVRAVAELAADPAALWAGFGRALVRIDPAGGGVQTQTRTDREIKGLSVGPGGDVLYAAEESDEGLFVTKRHPLTGALRLRSAGLEGASGGGARLTSTSDGVWVSYPTGMHGALVRLRAGDLRQVAQIVPEPDSNLGTNAVAGFAAGGILWIVDAMGSPAQIRAVGNSATPRPSTERVPSSPTRPRSTSQRTTAWSR